MASKGGRCSSLAGGCKPNLRQFLREQHFAHSIDLPVLKLPSCCCSKKIHTNHFGAFPIHQSHLDMGQLYPSSLTPSTQARSVRRTFKENSAISSGKTLLTCKLRERVFSKVRCCTKCIGGHACCRVLAYLNSESPLGCFKRKAKKTTTILQLPFLKIPPMCKEGTRTELNLCRLGVETAPQKGKMTILSTNSLGITMHALKACR